MAERAKKDGFTADDDALLGELGVEVEPEPQRTHTAREERILAGFEEVVRWADEHGRPPAHGGDRDIFERLYAVRLDRMRGSDQCRALLAPLDEHGLLDAAASVAAPETDDELLAALGLGETDPHAAGADDITVMRHVRGRGDRSSPEEVAARKPCEHFDAAFRPRFERVRAEIAAGARRTEPFKGRQTRRRIAVDDLFILDGQTALVAGAGQPFKAEHGETDRRLRVVFDNGTESDLLLRSLRRALNKDDASRRVLPPEPAGDGELGPLFADADGPEEPADGGRVYVARSLSDHPFLAEHRDVLHKIGSTGGDPAARVAGARKDPTFLLAPAEVVAGFAVPPDVSRRKLERLLHRYFAAVRADIDLRDRFGDAVRPGEWFFVPLPAVEEAVALIASGEITDRRYDPAEGRSVPADPVGGG